MVDDGSLGADGVRSGDLNGDGLPDLVASWEQGGIARAYLMVRKDSGAPAWEAVTVGQAADGEDALFVDLDGDRRLDVVSSTEGRTRRILVHWGPADGAGLLDASRWSTETLFANGSQWMFAEAGELDGRPGPELLVGGKNQGATVGWLERPPAPRDVAAWSFHRLGAVGWVMSLVLWDMDGDGDQDLLLSDRRGPLAGVRWLENPGAGSPDLRREWANHWVGARGREAMFVAVHDLDGDGRPEIVVPHYAGADRRLTIFEAVETEDATWRSHDVPYPEVAGRPKSVAVGDLDLDGKPDLVLASERAGGARRGIVWLRAVGSALTGPWETHDISGPAGRKFDLSLLLDVDGDGDVDVVNTEESDNAAGGKAGLGVIWYENPIRRYPRPACR